MKNNFLEKLKTTRILGSIGVGASLLGIFLPYMTLTFLGLSESFTLFNYWEGKIALILTIVSALFIFKDYISKFAPKMYESAIGKKIKEANEKFVLIPTISNAVLAIYMFTEIETRSYFHYSIGFYLIWIGIITLIAHSILYKGKAPITENTNNTTTAVTQPQMQEQPQVFNTNVTYAQPQVQEQPQIITQNTEEPQIQQPNTKVCPNCGNTVDASAAFCTNCGNRF